MPDPHLIPDPNHPVEPIVPGVVLSAPSPIEPGSPASSLSSASAPDPAAAGQPESGPEPAPPSRSRRIGMREVRIGLAVALSLMILFGTLAWNRGRNAESDTDAATTAVANASSGSPPSKNPPPTLSVPQTTTATPESASGPEAAEPSRIAAEDGEEIDTIDAQPMDEELPLVPLDLADDPLPALPDVELSDPYLDPEPTIALPPLDDTTAPEPVVQAANAPLTLPPSLLGFADGPESDRREPGDEPDTSSGPEPWDELDPGTTEPKAFPDPLLPDQDDAPVFSEVSPLSPDEETHAGRYEDEAEDIPPFETGRDGADTFIDLNSNATFAMPSVPRDAGAEHVDTEDPPPAVADEASPARSAQPPDLPDFATSPSSADAAPPARPGLDDDRRPTPPADRDADGWITLPNGGTIRTPGEPRLDRVAMASDVPIGTRQRSTTDAEPVSPVRHVVQRNENFWTISRSYYGSGRYYRALHAANRDIVPVIDELYVGTTIRVPPFEALDASLFDPPRQVARSRREPETITEPRPSADQDADRSARQRPRLEQTSEIDLALPVGRDQPSDGARASFVPESRPAPRLPVYQVRPRDTLRSIARDTLGDARRDREILELNRGVIRDPSDLVPGQPLRLPADARLGLINSP